MQNIELLCDCRKELKELTAVDFLAADLATEQQSEGTAAKYLKEREVCLTSRLHRAMLVLHGTSSLKNQDINSLNDDGVVRVNMWTRIVRESCMRLWACSTIELFRRK